MARENIRFQEGNLAGDGTYYYSMLDGAQVLQQKVDDGTVAFSYPLDTAVAGNIKGLEWDGVYFWSLEDRSGGDGVTVRKWGIESFVCKQQQIFEFTDGPTHTYNCDALAVEHYRLTVGTNVLGGDPYTDPHTLGFTNIHVSDNSMLEPGDVLTFVRKYTSAAQRVGTSFVEQATVQTTVSGSTTEVELTTQMQGDPYGDGLGFRGANLNSDLIAGTQPPTPDDVFVTKFIWLANDDSPNNPGTPSLYKIRSANGTNVIQFSGSQYTDVNALTFYTKYVTAESLDASKTPYNVSVTVDGDAGGRQTHLLVARGTSLLFFNTDTNVIDRSLVMNNIKTDTISYWNVDDMLVGGVEPNIVLYRLQQGTTYKNESLVLTDESWSDYNYEKQLLRRVVNSIAVSVEPSIIPADGSSTATATAVLRDQYNNLVPSNKSVVWSTDGSDPINGGSLAGTNPSFTDEFGEATIGYQAGTVEQDVKIVASVENGLITE